MADKKLSELTDDELKNILQLATDLDVALTGVKEGGVRIALQDFLKDAWGVADRRDVIADNEVMR